MALNSNQLKDKSVREAYEKAVDEKKPMVGSKDVAKIIQAAMDGKKVTRKERRDILLILKEAPMTTEAKSKLKDFAYTRFAYLGPNESTSIAKIVGNTTYTQFINFTFGENSYVPSDYAYIAKKIRDCEIDVYTYNYSEDVSKETFGIYNSLEDELYVADLRGDRTPIQRSSTIIHEATHAIQDKQNKALQVQHAEAGAHIAQAIMLLTIGGGSTDMLYGRLKQPGISDAASKVYNSGNSKHRGVLDKSDRTKALEVIKKSKAYGSRSENRTAMDTEWYSFFESLAYKLGI